MGGGREAYHYNRGGHPIHQMKWTLPKTVLVNLFASAVLMAASSSTYSQERKPGSPVSSLPGDTVGELVKLLRVRASGLESSSGMRTGYQTFIAAHKLPPKSVRYSDYVLVRLLFEATRDAGFWNLRWAITDQPPNSERIWKQWQMVRKPTPLESTATAECDELSALYAFLVERTGVKSVGLLWPTPNHTVAVWVVHPATGPVVRVVVPTSQIFLDQNDRFDTKKFDPWHQKTIYEYTRRDVPDSFELPKSLFEFFLRQVDKFGGASDTTLQQLRYLREGVYLKSWSPEQAASEALKRRSALGSGPAEDLEALQNFAQDMRSGAIR